MNIQVFENNGGMIFAIVSDDKGETKNILFGFEDGTCSRDVFLAAAKTGFEYSDEYNPDDYSGLSLEQAAEEIRSIDNLIAEISAEDVTLYPKQMGIAGTNLFAVEQE